MPLSNPSIRHTSNSHRQLQEDTNRTADSKERPHALRLDHQIEPLSNPQSPFPSALNQRLHFASNQRIGSNPPVYSEDHHAKMTDYLQKNAYYFHPKDKSANVSTFTPSDNYNKFGSKPLNPIFTLSAAGLEDPASQQPVASLGKVRGAAFFESQL